MSRLTDDWVTSQPSAVSASASSSWVRIGAGADQLENPELPLAAVGGHRALAVGRPAAASRGSKRRRSRVPQTRARRSRPRASAEPQIAQPTGGPAPGQIRAGAGGTNRSPRLRAAATSRYAVRKGRPVLHPPHHFVGGKRATLERRSDRVPIDRQLRDRSRHGAEHGGRCGRDRASAALSAAGSRGGIRPRAWP